MIVPIIDLCADVWRITGGRARIANTAALTPLRDSGDFGEEGEEECRSDNVFHVAFNAGRGMLEEI